MQKTSECIVQETSQRSTLALADLVLFFLGQTRRFQLRLFRELVFLKMVFRLEQLAVVSTFHYVNDRLINRTITGNQLCHRAML